MKKNILKLTGILILFTILLAGCNPSKMTFGNSEKWIPQDFDPSKTILLVEKFKVSDKAEQKMEDYMSENYGNKYEFVDLSVIKNREGKYANTKLYKYALVISSHTNTITKAEGASTSGGLRVTGFDFNFYDRELDKNYPPTKRASSYAITTFKPVINTIVKKFE
ncbi:MAG: hypothetical protein KA319_01680 [Ferruginibacter sp.]|nr:hypothetical protein [Ferruginibacter sp.]